MPSKPSINPINVTSFSLVQQQLDPRVNEGKPYWCLHWAQVDSPGGWWSVMVKERDAKRLLKVLCGQPDEESFNIPALPMRGVKPEELTAGLNKVVAEARWISPPPAITKQIGVGQALAELTNDERRALAACEATLAAGLAQAGL